MKILFVILLMLCIYRVFYAHTKFYKWLIVSLLNVKIQHTILCVNLDGMTKMRIIVTRNFLKLL